MRALKQFVLSLRSAGRARGASLLYLAPDQLKRLRTTYKRRRIENPYIGVDSLICYTCGKPIRVGEPYLSSPRGSKRYTKFRHYECAKRVGLI